MTHTAIRFIGVCAAISEIAAGLMTIIAEVGKFRLTIAPIKNRAVYHTLARFFVC